ncbi:MAG: hypothetical protein AUH30_04530 [Candidatus Rokubacteria bacterium 13_1_40CM_68_15]|nr:MAG: hypothetical protein AUH30_04530 [Candidatus Rokubacteria bacterium 13_1_40CM_68_15]
MPTPSAYFDTSVVVKRYVNEPSSIRARELFRRFRLVSSTVVPVELSAAIRRRMNLGDIDETGMTAALRRINDDRVRWELIEVAPPVLSRAETVALQFGVPALDAIHIASALVLADELGRRPPFFTADARQREAAARVNLEVVWVG